MKRFVIASILLAFTVPAMATGRGDFKSPRCVTPARVDRYTRYVLQFSNHNGNFKANTPTKTRLAKLAAMRACALHQGDKTAYVKMLHYWHVRHAEWKKYKFVDSITTQTGPDCPGEYVVPTWIVHRESGCSPTAVNGSSGAYGWYQLMPEHYRGHGKCVGLTHSEADQHVCAYRLKRAAGLRPWNA